MGLIGQIRRAIGRSMSGALWAVGRWARSRHRLPADPQAFRRIDPFVGSGPGRWRLTDSVRDSFRRSWFRLRLSDAASPRAENAVFGDPGDAASQ